MRRVLLVDDSRLQRRILSASLARDGYEVLEAETGDQALKICRESPPDLVLSDLIMPGMDGLEFCQAFRALPGDQYGYFILLTSKSEKEEMVRGLEGGADDFVSKPVNAHELRARISAGERILRMQRELTDKNRMISDTLDELQRVYDSLDRDLIEAKKLQQSLVRERYLDFGTGAVSLELLSSGHVGGDLVGQYRVNDHCVGLFSIDVSGHGISSALMTARLAGYLSSSSVDQNVALQKAADGSQTYLPPHEVIARLNHIIMDELETELYFTMFLAVIDLRSGSVEMAQAGHPHPVVLRSDGTIEQDGPGGLPVGLISGAEFTPFETTLGPGDRLLILSDGVTECPNETGEMLGEDGLADMVSSLARQSVDTLLEELIWRLGEFAGGSGFPDDVSGVLFEFRGPET
ncbi:sigma-B regulation protein RsbU (phosphoserine phosphatase) [Shimia gijangensis]|uniref:Sigma-B regulation protein RsbU (Phosphoserine phosphatase) n=1 Tax=Shimia gijangensis TaxID=1470563 RepID=A0A1M6MQA9_9RHOB|nr:fused response regulator/phosphatase [Shimia gijangensis]SHJ85624.1 sigma-B regulation protein RsbU (phosphoserine phosphatase) [Shimia gijangensis]